MAIKIIKHGKEVFKAVCPVCECEFSYQVEDLKEDAFSNHYVECPDCGNIIIHISEEKKKSIDDSFIRHYYPSTVSAPTSTWPDCETCPNKPDPNKTVAGDTPCTWCSKNQPYCIADEILPYTESWEEIKE